MLTREEILDRYDLIDDIDCGHFENNGCHAWSIYYKEVYAYVWLATKTEYGCTVWVRHKTDFDTGTTGWNKYTVNKEGLFNILDRYIPRRKEIKLF